AEGFDERQRASRSLEAFGEAVGPALRAARKDAKDIETRLRLDALLAKLAHPPPAVLRTLRGIEALEHIGSPEARAVLEKLAKGAPESRITQDAKESLGRLGRKR
ncbi:MAG: hypothetical protein K2W96_27690, partial [Gemmataceae bacterium]|nr:hypothetical protein [Gemmataceae bacterium]